jgi:two-component SAPR family response regulator
MNFIQGSVSGLDGKRIIVVEDDAILARDMAEQLREIGATVLGPAPTAFYALQLIGPERRKLDAAVLDTHLHGATVYEFADVLKDRGVPFLFATGYDRSAIPSRFHDAPLLQKPLGPSALEKALTEMVYRPVPQRVQTPLPPVTFSNEPAEALFARALARTLGRPPV